MRLIKATSDGGRVEPAPPNNIAPGAIETPINTKLLNDPQKLGALLAQIPLGRLGQTRDVSSVAVFLASDDADYVTGST